MIVIPFIPKHEFDIENNMTSYIEHIKEHSIFFRGQNKIKWCSVRWELTPFYPSRGNFKTVAIFTEKAGKKAKPFEQPFMDEAKALVADYLRHSKTRKVSKLVCVLRRIYASLPSAENGKSLTALSDVELYSIETSISNELSDAYSYSRLLQRLVSNFIEPAKITKSRLSWLSSVKRKQYNRSNLVGERNQIVNSPRNKLPDLRCIFDLAAVFNSTKSEPDIIVSSWFAISMYAPSRATEILTLSIDCERFDDDADGSGHGIVWRPEKGGEPLVKRAASEESAEVARTAIQRLIDLGKSARIAAKWYEVNPTSLFLPEGYEHLRGKDLTLYEMGMIIGRNGSIPNKHQYKFGIQPSLLTTNDPARTGGASWRRLYTFESLENYVLKKLPVGWPYADQITKLKYSEALFTMPFDIMRGYSTTCIHIPQFITYASIRYKLTDRGVGETIFSSNNLIDPSTGKPWELRTHQPRHLLNTIAQSKHISQELIAFWSGRKSVKQNEYYDHTSQEFIIEAFLKLEETAPKELIVTGPLAEKIKAREANEPISRTEALKEEISAFHITKYGYCRHDFSLTPCPKDKWCNNCGEAFFVKGDVRQIKRGKQEVARFIKSLETAKQAKKDGEYGVDQWIDKLELDLSRASLKLEKLTDPDVEDGTIITLPQPINSQSKAGLSMEIRRVEIESED